MQFGLDRVAENIRIVDSSRNYWFVRTYSGMLYDEFFERSFVAIGYNSVPLGLIKKASESDDSTILNLKNAISSSYNLALAEVTKVAKQLIDFHQNVAIGDMIIMPSENSAEFAFGIVESSIFQVKSKSTFMFRDQNEPFPEKRRTIKWLKIINKHDLNGDFGGLTSRRSAISNVNSYRDLIEGYLSSVYIREDKLYLTIQIDQEEDINAFAFNNFLSGLTYFYAEFLKENGEEYNEELFLKIKVQSKGKVALKCISVAAGISLTALVVMSSNSEVKLNLLGVVKFEGKASDPLKAISKFLDASQERRHKEQLFQDSLVRLKARAVAEPVEKNEDSVSLNSEATQIVKDSIINHATLKNADQKKIGSSRGGQKDKGNN